MRSGSSEKAAIAAGYSEKYASKQSWSFLNNPKIKAALSTKPSGISDEAYYTRAKAINDYDRVLEQALKESKLDEAIRVIDAKVKLFGLVLEPKGEEAQAAGITNNIYSLGSDDELYDLLKRKREAGNGIDTESIGHDVAGLAKAIPQNHRQAVKATAART